MREIDCGRSGQDSNSSGSWHDLGLDPPWPDLIARVGGGSTPRPIQALALREGHLFDSRRNLLVAAPTNGGKSLIGTLFLLDAIRRGGRAVLLEPLRALAQEKFEELKHIASVLEATVGQSVEVRITTGDYRLESEHFDAAPPNAGQIIIATPERLDAILRDPENQPWVESISAVCVDEVHLISSPRRGPTLEYLLTSLLCLPRPPRLALLSASLGDTSRAQQWLEPCDAIVVSERTPSLQKMLFALDEEESVDETLLSQVTAALSDPAACVLIFVYQTRSAESLSQFLNDRLGSIVGPKGVLPFHSRMSRDQRASTRMSFESGDCRCVVATTALAMGVNLPATHVFIRDLTFHGGGSPTIPELLQMMGRAGRGNQPGFAGVFLQPGDRWTADELGDALVEEPLPELRSSFDRTSNCFRRDGTEEIVKSAAQVAAVQLARHEEGLSQSRLHDYFTRSLGGGFAAEHLTSALRWLCEPSRILAVFEDDRYRLTMLGMKAVRGILPLQIAGAIGQFLRDLLEVDPDDSLLGNLSPIDILFLLECLSDWKPSLRRFSKKLTEQVDGWVESFEGEKPVLYRQWIQGTKSSSNAFQLLGSLGISLEKDTARQVAYLAMFHSIILYDRGKGILPTDLERRWHIANLNGVEEEWRDQRLWLLPALSRILETRSFYFHLRENCLASDERVKRVDRCLKHLRGQIFGLQEHLKYCSPLGPILRSIRRTSQGKKSRGIGHRTIQCLEAAGVNNVADLSALRVDQLVALGVSRSRANWIRSYIHRRAQ